VQAVQELFALGGIAQVLVLAHHEQCPWHVGIALGQSDIIADRKAENCLLSDVLGAPDTALRDMAFGFLRGHVAVGGRAWLQAVRATHTMAWESFADDSAELLGVLQQSPETDISRPAPLEWFFLPLLDRLEREPKTLHRALAQAPDFFVEVLSWAYKAEAEEPRELSEAQRFRGQLQAELLHSWRLPPGLGEDGTVNPGQLRTWVTQARELAGACGRGRIGDQYITRVLINYPKGIDGAWPHEAVRDLLERVASEDFEVGSSVGIANSRGVVQRAIGEGGAQERTLAERYAKDVYLLRNAWPRMARLMQAIAKSYEAEPRGGDAEAEMEEDLWR
jgi:hypothetical protein